MNRVYSVRIANIFASVVMVLPAPLRQDSVSAPKAGRDSLVIGHAAATNMASIVSRIARVEMAAHVTRKMALAHVGRGISVSIAKCVVSVDILALIANKNVSALKGTHRDVIPSPANAFV